MADLETLSVFDSNNGAVNPASGLLIDASGNLYGTASGSGSVSTVYEVAKTNTGYSVNPTTLATFQGSVGLGTPSAALVADASGNLFGTQTFDGASNLGSVFEIAKTGTGYSSPTTLVSFNATNGAVPEAGLITDASGDLFGTTTGFENSQNIGTVFEIPKVGTGYSSTPTVLASFNAPDIYPESGLVADASGNLYGTTIRGGAFNDGTVFEVAKTATGYSSTPTTLVSFNQTDGNAPATTLITDASGDLFGTTDGGGASGDGTVFEIAKSASGYASTPTTLVSFNGSDGAGPEGGLIADAAGNLFGTTADSGPYGDGTVYEIAKTAAGFDTTPTTLVAFNGANGSEPLGGVIADSSGDLFGTTLTGGGGPSYGTVFEITDSGFVTCFASGTRIRTTRGDVPVEALVVGDLAVTASGARRPIRWIGHRTIDCRDRPRAASALPIRIAANAFGAGVPARDLFLSPGHPVLVGANDDGQRDGDAGHLVPIMCLINGTTVRRVAVESVTYWHVELDAHDVLLAEGLPAESYLDWGDRAFFTEGADHALQNPDFVVPGLAGRCRPVAIDGPVVEAERRRLDGVFAMRLAAACDWDGAEAALGF